jgi:hypothetical protein
MRDQDDLTLMMKYFEDHAFYSKVLANQTYEEQSGILQNL